MKEEGGDVILKKYENGVAYVSLKGACYGCPMASVTLENVVGDALIGEVDEVLKVVGVD